MLLRQAGRRFITFHFFVLFFALVFCLHLAMITIILKDEALIASFSTLAAPVETLLAVAGLLWAARRSALYSRELLLAWSLLVAAHVAWLVGDIVWVVLEVGLGLDPYPSIADVFYLLYYPFFIAGAFLIPMKRLSREEWHKLLMDMGIVALATILIFWYFWIGPLVETEGTDLLTVVLSVAYPSADLILLIVLLVVLSRKSVSQPRGPIWLLAASIAFQVLTDAVFGYQSTAGTYKGGVLDMGWVAAIFFAGLAGFLHADTVGSSAILDDGRIPDEYYKEAMAPWVSYIPYIWLGGAYLLLIFSYGRDIPMTFPNLIIWVGIIFLLVVVRQFTSLRENIRLLNRQEEVHRALGESERKYRAVVEHAKEGIVVVQDGLIKYLNPSAADITGYRYDEIIGRPFANFIRPEDATELTGEYERKLSGDERTFPTRYRIVAKGGTIKWIESNGMLIEWEGMPAILSFARNITDQKRAEQEKEEKNRRVIRYQAALLYLAKADASDLSTMLSEITETAAETLPADRVGIWLFSEDRTDLVLMDLFKSRECVHEAGHRLPSARHPRYFSELDRSRIIASDDAVTDERTAECAEKYFIPFDIRAVIDVPIRMRGSVVGVLCYEHTGSSRQWLLEEQEFAASMADTTSLAMEAHERKNAEAALQESEEQHRMLFENSLDTMFTVDLEGRFTSINRAGEVLSGYRRDEMIGQSFRRYITPEVAELIFSAYNTLYRTGKPISGLRYSFIGKDGRERMVEGYVALQKKGDTVIGFHGTLKDITERLKLQRQLMQSQKMEAVGTMAGGIAHNFNNIMVGIMGYSEFLMMNRKPDDPDYKALNIIHEGTVRASQLTKQLLSVSRGGQFSVVTVRLNQVIERILPLIFGAFDRSIDVQTHLAPDLMMMEGDLSQIEQCLLNLCINARDAMPDGGRIIIETANQVLDDDFLQSHLGAEPGPHVVVTITDTGVGITAEAREHIFEPFFTTKHHQGGTGMGLATVYGIVRSHHGIISVYSELGKGSSFKLYFPATLTTTDELVVQREKSPSMPGTTILLIDDEPVVREVWSDYLSQKGYRVITAEDGRQGIDRFTEFKDTIDLVILDLIMPNLGGKETLAALRKIDPAVKVLITSGYSENGQAGEIVNLGIDGFVQKPSQLTHLEKRIVEIMKK
jgi:two-component system cell cycle sensor histidine kinase/response regulator CckA